MGNAKAKYLAKQARQLVNAAENTEFYQNGSEQKRQRGAAERFKVRKAADKQ